MKLDLNKPLLDLEQKPITDKGVDATLGKVLASQLAGSSEGNAVKNMIFATLLYNGSPIEPDKADFDMIEKFVENNRQLTNLAKAAILNEMREQRDARKTPKAE